MAEEDSMMREAVGPTLVQNLQKIRPKKKNGSGVAEEEEAVGSTLA